MFTAAFAQYKRFEKHFFKADKAKDMTAYIKLKHQFRAMLVVPGFAIIPTLYLLIFHGFFIVFVPVLLSSVLIGFRTKSYRILQAIFYTLMTLIPIRYIWTPHILVIPASILLTNMQILAQIQSISLMVAHLATQSLFFYFYGLDFMMAKIKGMSPEELAEDAKFAVGYSVGSAVTNMVCMRLFNSQFLSLLRKVNTLKDDLSKANNQLNDQNLKLQNNLELKDVFIYTFSHELKNALNGLLGNLFLACDTAKDHRVIQFLTSAKVCGEVLKNFVHNILDSGKLENGNLEVSPEKKDVMNFFQNAWRICGRIIQNKRLEGFLEIEKNVPRYLELDEQRMIQIILNLVSNACKFTEKGYVRLRVSWKTISINNALQLQSPPETSRTHRDNFEEDALFRDMSEFPDSQDGSLSNRENNHLVMSEYRKKFISGKPCYQLNLKKSQWNQGEVLSSKLPGGSKGILKIQILDSGCGMTAEEQGRLFQKFSQVNQLAGQRKVGTGLGLWICKELASRMNGDIKTRSNVGVGSVFELTVCTLIPKILEKSRSRNGSLYFTANNSLMKLPSEPKVSSTRKILLADDDSFNIELMKNYLNKFGINYLCAYDGEEAVSLFRKHYKEIGFVITDNFMPKKTGVEAALEIAGFLEEQGQPKIPIMCISGDLKVSAGERGITSVIQKPINFDRLKEELMIIFPQVADGCNNRFCDL